MMKCLARYLDENSTAGDGPLTAIVGIIIGNTLALSATIRRLTGQARGAETVEWSEEQAHAHPRQNRTAQRQAHPITIITKRHAHPSAANKSGRVRRELQKTEIIYTGSDLGLLWKERSTGYCFWCPSHW